MAPPVVHVHWVVHRIPEPIVINVGYVFVQEFCYIISKHKVSKLFSLPSVAKLLNCTNQNKVSEFGVPPSVCTGALNYEVA